ncbi:MAG: hypothetical protein ACRD17_03445 [Terriglobales bacterium]
MEDNIHGGGGMRRPEDIALDLMRYIAQTTSYGQKAGGDEQYAEKLLQLYRRCVAAVQLGA